MATVVVIGGPRGIGKTYLGELLDATLGVSYIDGDSSILAWMKAGVEPDPEDGWLEPMQAEVLDRLKAHESASVEITGEWESGYRLIKRLQQADHRTVRIWLTAPEDEVIERLLSRNGSRRLQATEAEGRDIYRRGATRAAQEQWDLILDMSGAPNPKSLLARVRPLLGLAAS